MNRNQLRSGDLVRIKNISEIQKSLDAKGALDNLVFMPEMATLCGRTVRVSRRATHVVTDGAPVGQESRVRMFHNDNVVVLENVRCSGLAHDGCKRGCLIFWKEAWLDKIESLENGSGGSDSTATLHTPTTKDAGCYYCQSSEMLRATRHMTGSERLLTPFRAVLAGNYSILRMLRMVAVWTYWKSYRKIFGEWPAGNQTETPAEVLNLQPGEWVQVKSLPEIIQTLDKDAKNRGLHFSADMPPYCGKRFRVASRADKLIAEGSGKMRQLKNTVTLEGSVCDSAIFSLGGCPREDLLYWREIWLKRVDPSPAPAKHPGSVVQESLSAV
jgi:hypothetical protein